MKRLAIHAKVALWSALLAGLAMGTAMVGMFWFLRYELLSSVERRMERAATEIFWGLDRHPNGPADGSSMVTEDMIPPSAESRFVEISGPNGELLYRSKSLKAGMLEGGSSRAREVWIESAPYRVETFRYANLTLILAQPLKSTYATLDRVKLSGLLALGLVTIFGLGGGWWVASFALKPIRTITEVARHISAEDPRQRLPVPAARDEIRLLTKVLNGTFDRLERSYQQATRFASDASHQLKTPVTVMRAAIEDLLRAPDLRPGQAAALNDLLDQTRRLTSLADGLLLLAQADAGRIETDTADDDIIPIIESCIEDAEILAASQNIRFEREFPASLHAVADPHRTEQVLLNLLENAVKYNCQGGCIRVRAGSRKDGVFVTIANTGTPIPPDRAPWIFDRFARGDRFESRAGHGLGLSIARELAAAQGGCVRLLRSDADWTEFEFRLRHPSASKRNGDSVSLLIPPPRPRFPEIPVDR
jgi:signal transduction histidine kinase